MSRRPHGHWTSHTVHTWFGADLVYQNARLDYGIPWPGRDAARNRHHGRGIRP